MHLRPAEPGQAVVVEREQEAFGIEPGLLLAGAQHVDGPAALLRVPGERAVVHRAATRPRPRPTRNVRTVVPSGHRGRIGEGERHPHLQEVTFGDEARGGGSGVGAGSASVPWTQ